MQKGLSSQNVEREEYSCENKADAEKNIDYIDAFYAMILKNGGIEEIYSYDPHYNRIEGLTRLGHNH